MSFKEYLIKSNVQVVLAILVVVWCLYALTFKQLDSDIKIVFAGYIGLILGFYYGSSRSSQIKDLSNKEKE